MIMVRWEDESELVIYRSLAFIRKLIKEIEHVAPPDDAVFWKDPKFYTKFDHLNYFSGRRSSYYFKPEEFRNLQAFEFLNYCGNCPLN